MVYLKEVTCNRLSGNSLKDVVLKGLINNKFMEHNPNMKEELAQSLI
jgi:hypothetical protein